MEKPLEISVVFTRTRETAAALRAAARLANDLSARITLLAPQVVPFPLPLTSPPVSVEWSMRRLRTLVSGQSDVIDVDLRLCRNASNSVLNALKPHSIVVIGHRKRWWPTAETSLARKARAQGHEVVLAQVN